jgi:uncharacterized protein YecA (UPF0149 family)
MDVRTGRIYESRDLAPEHVRPHLVEMELKPTPLQRIRRRVGRNDPCPCGSGKKFKHCHRRTG